MKKAAHPHLTTSLWEDYSSHEYRIQFQFAANFLHQKAARDEYGKFTLSLFFIIHRCIVHNQEIVVVSCLHIIHKLLFTKWKITYHLVLLIKSCSHQQLIFFKNLLFYQSHVVWLYTKLRGPLLVDLQSLCQNNEAETKLLPFCRQNFQMQFLK